jgi:hypothetical protein
MTKTLIVALCCLLTMGAPVFADSAMASTESDISANDGNAAIGANEGIAEETFQELIVPVQWGGRTWTCWARSRRSGRTFSGSSRNANIARRVALDRCWSRSPGACVITRCR